MHDLKDIQVELLLKDGKLKIPETPVTLAKDAMTIWPFNLPMADARLIFSTAQPLCVVNNGKEKLYVFFANGGVPPQYVFDAATVKNTAGDDRALTVAHKEGQVKVDAIAPGTNCLLQVTTAKGETLKVLTLTRQQAMHCWRGNLWGQTRLLLTDGTLIPTETEFRLRSIGIGQVGFCDLSRCACAS